VWHFTLWVCARCGVTPTVGVVVHLQAVHRCSLLSAEKRQGVSSRVYMFKQLLMVLMVPSLLVCL
jgi:hypothetical protein